MSIIIYNISHNKITNSEGRIISIPPYLDWLIAQSPEDIHMLWNLDHAVANLCKMIELTPAEIKKLWETKKLYIPPYVIKYIPGVFLIINKGFGVGQESILLGNMETYMDSRPIEKEEDIEWQLAKAKCVAEEVLNTLTNTLGLHPKTLTKPITSYQKEVLGQMKLPTLDDYPDEADEYAYQCLRGGWIEGYKKGHFDKVWDYDLRAAYPSELINLLDIRQGVWGKVQEIPVSCPVDAMGFFKANMDMRAEFHPMLIKDSKDNTFTPKGWQKEVFLTLNMVRFIEKWKLGVVEIIDGWLFCPTGQRIYPLRKVVNELYGMREKAVGVEKEVIKFILLGIWGKLLEYKRIENSFGEMFCAAWGAQVETDVRLRVSELALSNGIMPVSIIVDGLVSDRKLVLPKDKGIGSWKLNTTGKALAVGSGAIAIQGKKNSGDFSLDYDWIMEQIRQNPEATSIEMRGDGFISIARAVQHEKYARLGEIDKVHRSLILDDDIKRGYPGPPRNFGELVSGQFESKAWDMSLISQQA
jgi:hypothetical protein